MIGLAIIFLFWLLGESIVQFLNIPFPGSVLGMLLLALGVGSKWIRLETVEEASQFFRKNLSLFFIPAGVMALKYADIFHAEGWILVVSAFASTALILVLGGRWMS